jgi:hypothetical protein
MGNDEGFAKREGEHVGSGYVGAVGRNHCFYLEIYEFFHASDEFNKRLFNPFVVGIDWSNCGSIFHGHFTLVNKPLLVFFPGEFIAQHPRFLWSPHH